MTGENLLGVPPTLLNPDGVGEALAASARSGAAASAAGGSVGASNGGAAEGAAAASGADLEALARQYPTSSLVWALLADRAYAAGEILPSYAYARVGYHRGLDALRKGGWRGQGPVPWSHEPNRGVLRSLYALRRAAEAIGEQDEVVRLTEFLTGADPQAVPAIEAETAETATTAKPATPAEPATPAATERL